MPSRHGARAAASSLLQAPAPKRYVGSCPSSTALNCRIPGSASLAITSGNRAAGHAATCTRQKVATGRKVAIFCSFELSQPRLTSLRLSCKPSCRGVISFFCSFIYSVRSICTGRTNRRVVHIYLILGCLHT